MTTPRIYVGTYAKYNSGSIAGKWLNLEDYSDKDEFLEACAKLHADEDDPEFMFQDFEGFPRGLYSESSISDELWEWLELDDDDRELLEVYQEHINQDGDIDDAREAFMGRASSDKEWAYQWADDTGLLEGMPDHLEMYFDWDSWLYSQQSDWLCLVNHGGETWAFDRNR